MAAPTRRQLAETLAGMPLYQHRNRLRYAITICNRDQDDIAEATGLNKSEISRIARGRQAPTASQKATFARYFGVSTEILFPELEEAVA